MSQKIEAIIMGGGQAGLATSYYLTQRGRNLSQSIKGANYHVLEFRVQLGLNYIGP
jgi:cation diffusion facilitator CzcD-associated flavoprotein CzcO